MFYIYDGDADELVAAHAAGEHAGVVWHPCRDGSATQRMGGSEQTNNSKLRSGSRSRRSRQNNEPQATELPQHATHFGKQLVGVLTLYSPSREAFSEEHQRVVEIVARQVGASNCPSR